MQNTYKILSVWAVVVAAVLMIPVLGKWRWTAGDFMFGAVVLFGAAALFELIARKGSSTTYRVAVAIAVAAGLLLLWVNAAVGIISEDEWPNLLYLGVLVIGLLGAFVSRFKPRGLARTLFTMAVLQMLVPIIVLIAAKPLTIQNPGIVGVFGLTAFSPYFL